MRCLVISVRLLRMKFHGGGRLGALGFRSDA